MFASNPYQTYQAINKYPAQYQFPATTGGLNPYLSNDEITVGGNNQVYGLKFGNEPMYGHSGLETQSQYGPPMMQSKGGKLKGAALSALTLLAFLFFLNLLQSCLKEQMDSMNPTVMVMSAGQRTYLLSRNNGLDEEVRKTDVQFDEAVSGELLTNNEDQGEYEMDDYEMYQQQQMYENIQKQTPAPVKKRVKHKIKRPKSKSRLTQVSTIEPKLNNYYKVRSET